MKTWQMLLIFFIGGTKLLNHDRQGDSAPQPWSSKICDFFMFIYCFVLNFSTLLPYLLFWIFCLKNLREFILTNLRVLWYSVSIVINYNSFWDLNKFFFLNITCFGKNQQPVFLKLIFGSKQNKRSFFRMKTTKDFPKNQINSDVLAWTW